MDKIATGSAVAHRSPRKSSACISFQVPGLASPRLLKQGSLASSGFLASQDQKSSLPPMRRLRGGPRLSAEDLQTATGACSPSSPRGASCALALRLGMSPPGRRRHRQSLPQSPRDWLEGAKGSILYSPRDFIAEDHKVGANGAGERDRPPAGFRSPRQVLPLATMESPRGSSANLASVPLGSSRSGSGTGRAVATYMESEPWMSYSRAAVARSSSAAERSVSPPIVRSTATNQVSEDWMAYSRPPVRAASSSPVPLKLATRMRDREASVPHRCPRTAATSAPFAEAGLQSPRQRTLRRQGGGRSPSPTFQESADWMAYARPLPPPEGTGGRLSTPRWTITREEAPPAKKPSVGRQRSLSPTYNLSTNWMAYSSPSKQDGDPAPERRVRRPERVASPSPDCSAAGALQAKQHPLANETWKHSLAR